MHSINRRKGNEEVTKEISLSEYREWKKYSELEKAKRIERAKSLLESEGFVFLTENNLVYNKAA